jgi:hypothetical protein
MRTIAIITAACAALFSISCSQEKQLKAMKQFKKVAIIDIHANVIIPWKGEEKKVDDSAAGFKMLGKLAGSKKLESGASEAEALLNQTTQNTINDIGKAIAQSLASSQIFSLIPYESLDKSKIVRDGNAFQKASDNRARPAGFETFFITKNSIAKTCDALDLDGVIIVKTDYKRVVSFGNMSKNGTMFITANMDFTVFDRKGELLWKDTITKDSSDTFAVIAGIYDPSKLDKAVISSTENAGKALFATLKKRIDAGK